MQVAVLGTGTMGAGMSRSLLRAGHTVRVWNRTAAKAEPLAADGATVAGSPGEAVRGAEVVLVVLFDTAAVLEVLAAASGSAEPEAVWLQASTIGPDGTVRSGGDLTEPWQQRFHAGFPKTSAYRSISAMRQEKGPSGQQL